MTTATKTYAPGTFCWPELQTTSGEGAKTFYTGLFGWTAKEDPLPDGSTYIMFSHDGKSVGAAYQMSPETQAQTPPNWAQYVAVDSADSSAQKAKDAGGKVLMEPFDVMEHGRMAVVQDPTGGVFALWQPKAHQGADLRDEIGSMCWNELMTNDTARARAFYTTLFGWGAEAMEALGGDYTFFKNQDTGRESRNAGGLAAITPEMGPVPPHWLLYFCVQNCDATVAKARQLGAKALMPGMDIPPGRFAVLQDPQGAVFAVMHFNEDQK